MSTTALPRPAALGRPRSRTSTRSADPRWVRPALAGVLALAAVLVLWNLTINGYSNEYYAAAARAGSKSWKAWFFGSLDPGSFITVDKPPLSLWLMGLSARVFGFSSFAILLPQALCTVGAVGLTFATVRRVLGPAAGIASALALAITPVTVAIGRVNNPDALLVLLMVASTYCLVRALQSGRTRPLVVCGALVGLAFMTKMLQGWMVVPALALTYLLFGPPALGTRLRQLLAAGAAMVAVSAAWPIAVTLWPGDAPYIGGSDDGSVWNLILGYNGFGRIFGEGAGGGMGGSFGGVPGLWRLFNEQVGGQIAWLLPLAAVGLVAGLWLTRRAPRTDLRRAGLVLFGLWAIVHALVFSTQQGIFHPYYVSALAPAVAVLAGSGFVLLAGRARTSWAAVAVLGASVAGTAWLAVALLGRTPDFAPWLTYAIPVAAAGAVAALLLLRIGGRAAFVAAVVAGALAVGAGPASYAVANLGHSLNGNNVLAGPSSVSQGGMGGGPPSGSGFGTPPSGASGTAGAGGAADTSGAAGSSGPGGAAMGGGGISDEVIAYLQAHQGLAKYLLAASGSQTTASVIIATGEPVVTIGGFGGSDPTPTVAELTQLVADGDLKYVLVSGTGGGPGGGSNEALTSWVQDHGTAVTDVTVSSGTLYRVSA